MKFCRHSFIFMACTPWATVRIELAMLNCEVSANATFSNLSLLSFIANYTERAMKVSLICIFLSLLMKNLIMKMAKISFMNVLD